MKKIISILIGSLFITSICNAQVSGYMGKKLSIMYDIHTRPTFTEPNQNGNTGFTSLNFKNAFSLEYVVSRKVSLGVAFGFFNTDFTFKGKTFDYTIITPIGEDPYTYSPNALGKMSVTSKSIFMKIFLNNNLAPLGAYTKIQLDYFNWDWSFDKTLTDDAPPPANFNGSGSNNSYAISLSFGKQSIYFDKLLVNFSMQTGYLFNGYNILNDKYTYTDYNSVTPEAFMKDVTSSRLFVHYIWSVNFGIGYLIF